MVYHRDANKQKPLRPTSTFRIEPTVCITYGNAGAYVCSKTASNVYTQTHAHIHNRRVLYLLGKKYFPVSFVPLQRCLETHSTALTYKSFTLTTPSTIKKYSSLAQHSRSTSFKKPPITNRHRMLQDPVSVYN